ncbi:MAG: ribosome silencing factor [Chloroflexi bacterium]|nr:ribosome silencing factor [Chloroflexota bacterium]
MNFQPGARLNGFWRRRGSSPYRGPDTTPKFPTRCWPCIRTPTGGSTSTPCPRWTSRPHGSGPNARGGDLSTPGCRGRWPNTSPLTACTPATGPSRRGRYDSAACNHSGLLLSPIELARHIVDAVAARGAADTLLLDIRGLSVLADYFVVTTVSSTPQMRAVRDLLDRDLKGVAGRRPMLEGEAADAWVLADFGDVVVHVFSEEGRTYYQLEEFWTEAPVVLRIQ